MEILALDPGTTQTAFVQYDVVTGKITNSGLLPNEDMLHKLCDGQTIKHMAIEMIANMGQRVGHTIFETVLWIGRFIEVWLTGGGTYELVYRTAIKKHLCHKARAKDPDIRRALLARYGPDKITAIGTKDKPGPLYGIRRDVWSALAVAITATEVPVASRGGKGKVRL